jgi:hypothetical protein
MGRTHGYSKMRYNQRWGIDSRPGAGTPGGTDSVVAGLQGSAFAHDCTESVTMNVPLKIHDMLPGLRSLVRRSLGGPRA